MEQKHALGRRKSAVARVYVVAGTGNIVINGRELNDYFKEETLQYIVNQPFEVTGTTGQFDVKVTLVGGGTKGQAEAVRLGMMFVCTEVANEKHVYECLKYGVDMLWVGARTTANPFLMQEIADALRDTDVPVLVKNPINPDIDLWIGALERLNRAGVRKLGVIHRGFSTISSKPYRNAPGWQIAIELRTRYPNLPFFADPSHMGGDRKYLQELSQRAMDLGLEGLMIESHCNPEVALSDTKQQLVPADLRTLIESLLIREKDSGDKEYREGIEQLRSRIDYIDEDLLKELGARMEVSRKIGAYKRDHNVAILQTARWEVVMAAMKEKARIYGLSEKFIDDVFNAIHEESIRTQNEVLEASREA